MGLDVIQSQNLTILLEALMQRSSSSVTDAALLFQSKYFIVPSYGMGKWIEQRIAERQGISANHRYVGLRTFQWEMYQRILGANVVAKAPQMLNMKWRIFLFLSQYLATPVDVQHPLFSILQRVQQQSELIQDHIARQIKQQQMLYWVADHTSRLFANYMIYRGQCVRGCQADCYCRQNWLAFWGRDQALKLDHKMLRLSGDDGVNDQSHAALYAQTQAETLEVWQRFVWKQLFADDFQDMQKIDQDFWLALQDVQAEQKLPTQVYLFTLLELPPSQLNFLRRLAQFTQIQIFHYTPSQEYWADSVDPKWKAKYALKHPDAAVYYESRHPLLTRLGKQARDISALLSQLSGGEEGEWQDFFPDFAPENILQKVQSDILHLREPVAQEYVLAQDDRSLQVHVCYSTFRQLEVLKEQLIAWLNTPAESPRALDDILILVPNLQDVEPLIRTVFAQNYETAQFNLPIKIAGVPVLDAVQLWQALTLRMQLLQQRFTIEQFIDYLSLLPIQALYQLNFDEIERITVLLTQAGFKRGFDSRHLQQSLSVEDTDYRFSLQYAMQRLTLAIAMPEHALYADVLSISTVQHQDFELIAKLLNIYQDIDDRRDWLAVKAIDEQHHVEQHLECIEQELKQFSQISGFKSVEDAFNTLKRIIRVTIMQPHTSDEKSSALQLPLQYLLDEIDNTIVHQLGQTEPTGSITFAQMGQLRPLPYRLIVGLNLDMGTFPNRDHHIPFDLMELLRAELGDRSRLEDEQGAFLDALLQAQDGFWMFYNGFDVNDHEVRDPSSVLQELLSHLKEIVQKHPAQPEHIILQGVEVPAQLQSLFYIHPLQPFDDKAFTQHPSAYASQWFKVAQQLLQSQDQVFNWLNCAYPQRSAEKIEMNAQQWIKDLCNPARHFLRHVGIASVAEQSELDDVEPLQLNGLQRYTVNNYLLQQHLQQQNQQMDEIQQSDIAALLQDKLPIGKTLAPTLKMAIDEYHQMAARLELYGGVVTPLTQRRWQYDMQYSFVLSCPEDIQSQTWVSATTSNCRNERALHIWLEYLLWRASSKQTVDIQRIALYGNVTLIAQGLSRDQARQQLQHWLGAWQFAQQQPFILPPALFASVLEDCPIWQFDAHGNDDIENFAKLEQRWLGQKYYSNANFNQYNDIGCSLQSDWALLLMNQDAKILLHQYVERYAGTLYRPLTEHIMMIEDQV